MLTADGPKVIEFNVRFGDPEAQVVLPMLDEDLSSLCPRRQPARCRRAPARFAANRTSVSCWPPAVIPTPSRPARSSPVSTRPPTCRAQSSFMPAPARPNGQLVTAGGRVLTVVGRGATYRDAIETAYSAASKIRFDGMQFRRDIGRKAL